MEVPYTPQAFDEGGWISTPGVLQSDQNFAKRRRVQYEHHSTIALSDPAFFAPPTYAGISTNSALSNISVNSSQPVATVWNDDAIALRPSVLSSTVQDARVNQDSGFVADYHMQTYSGVTTSNTIILPQEHYQWPPPAPPAFTEAGLEILAI